MANCRYCGKPLIVNGGKCVYCGESVQGDVTPPPEKMTVKTILTGKVRNWKQKILKKSIITTLLSLALAIGILILKPWPGCLISIGMLLFSITTGLFSVFILNPKLSEKFISELGEAGTETLMNHLLNLIMIWGYFFFIAGVVCIYINWWSVLIAEIINVNGIIIMFGYCYEKVNK